MKILTPFAILLLCIVAVGCSRSRVLIQSHRQLNEMFWIDPDQRRSAVEIRHGDLVVTLRNSTQPAGPSAVALDIRGHGLKPQHVVEQSGIGGPIGGVGLYQLDWSSDELQPVIVIYTGGANCCRVADVFVREGSGWRRLQVADGVSGDDMAEPRRLSDGWAFVVPDLHFGEMFGGHATMMAPTLVLRLHGRQLVRDYGSAGAQALLLPEMQSDRRLCGAHDDPACAAYLALASELGGYDAARSFVESHFDMADGDYPHQRCGDHLSGGDCPSGERLIRSFPEALPLALMDSGYPVPKGSLQ